MLVVGSSEGVVSQLALAAGATRVDHVDIDTECVRRCAELLPYGYTPAELAAAEAGDGPVRMHYADGWQFLADAAARGDRWDVVIVDLPDEPVEVDRPRAARPALRARTSCAGAPTSSPPAGSCARRRAARRCGATTPCSG